jgi:hypothetical protein
MVDELNAAGYTLFADFLAAAPPEHSYNRIAAAVPTLDSFLDRMDEKGDFAHGLLDNHLGTAAENADSTNAAILLEAINNSTRYAVVTKSSSEDGYTSVTVPTWWVEDRAQ